MIVGITEAAQDISFPAHVASASRRSSTSCSKDPAIASVGGELYRSGRPDRDAQPGAHLHRR